MLTLDSLPKIGPKTLEKLEKLGISSTLDLLYHFPHRYLDFSKITDIRSTTPGETYTITAKVIDFQNVYTRNHKNIQKAVVADSTGQMTLTWFNQPYLSKNIKIGETYSFAGTVDLFRNQKTIIAPEYGPYNTGKIIAVYPETKGLSSKWFRTTIQPNLEGLLEPIVDPLPPEILKNNHLTDLKTALRQIHLPENSERLESARRRLALEETLSLQTESYLKRQEWLSLKPKYILKNTPAINKKVTSFIKSLPFALTSDQQKVWEEILRDLTSDNKITNRLLEGDVGSGKTIIAALGAYLSHLNGFATLILAPTEILARQHFQSFDKLFSRQKLPVFLLTSSNRLDVQKLPKDAIIISTHAVIFQKHRLSIPISLLVIDEQHKFGVKQRSFLSEAGVEPHTITMTATPIPRTISLTMLGNLSLSTIDTLPEGRQKVRTFLVPNPKIPDCYRWLEHHIRETGHQAFIVCPFIEASETLTTVKSAQKEFDHLSKIVFPNLKLALIHGRMKPPEREKILQDFLANKYQILVTTPIIEVGIDIKNATTIIIQSSDRFGLAQLHQLRGRVGRNSEVSYCYLFTDSPEPKVLNRLKFLETHHRGSDIAQYDLKIRGPGELFSTLQHGFPSLKMADLSDTKLIADSQGILESLIQEHPGFDLQTLLKKTSSTSSIVTTN